MLAAVAGGLDVQADPWAATPAGELHARLAGRCAFNARIDDSTIHLSFRFPWHISHAPHLPVLLQHNCTPPPAPIDNAKSEQIFAALLNRPTTGDGQCPF